MGSTWDKALPQGMRPTLPFEEKRETVYYTAMIDAMPEEGKPADLKKAEVDANMLRLRARGWSYKDIAASVGLPLETVRFRVNKMFDELKAEPLHHAFQLELHRLDMACRLIWEDLEYDKTNGDRVDTRLMQQWLDISGRRAKLLGLDAPKTLTVQALPGGLPTLPGDDAELKALVQDLDEHS